MGSTTIKWETGTSLLQCHNKCQEDFQCQSFLHKEAVGYCQLIYHGICTEQSETGTILYSKSGFREPALIGLDAAAKCTHFHQY